MAKTTKPAEIPTPTPTPVPPTPTPTPMPLTVEDDKEILSPEAIQEKIDTSIIMKVENLRAKGFDDNRIAATLMIHKHIVESI